ncbi:MAG: translation initiation factor [Vicingaceae bacterium]
MKKNKNDGFVYSTNPDFNYHQEEMESAHRSENQVQTLRVFPDRKNRKGKTVTVVSGFNGNSEELKSLEKELKAHCGCGGTTKEGEILIQGNFIQKVSDYLKSKKYKTKISGV